MPLPNLLHPIAITIQPLDKASTIYDPDTREEIQIVGRKEEIVIAAQIEYRDSVSHALGQAEYDEKGIHFSEAGYVLIRHIDAESLLYSPAIGDRIVEIGTFTNRPQKTTAYIHRMKPTMHYQNFGATATKLFFADRKPSHNG